MRIESNNINFGIYKGSRVKNYGNLTTGVFKDYRIDIHEGYEKNKLIHKLYCVYDNTGKWLKSKLKYYRDNKCFLTVNSTKGG